MTLLKKLLAMLLCTATVFTFTACDFDLESLFSDKEKEKEEEQEEEEDEKEEEETAKGELVEADSVEDEDLAYVLIYNPMIYDETRFKDKTALKTGDFGNQIEVDDYRSGGLEGGEEQTETETAASPYQSISQDQLNANIPWDQLSFDGSRGEPLGEDYDEGDEREFYCYSSYNINSRISEEFECVYAGEYCYVWSTGAADEDDLEEMGETFDEDIYEEVIDTFGEPRFVGESGKVNLLFYSMPGSYLGCFSMMDIFTEDEIEECGLEPYSPNANHAILHINADYLTDRDSKTTMCSTMAHELQHLICGTDYFYTVNETLCRTWLNEAMSGYIEGVLYPDSKDDSGHLSSFNNSYLIKYGQSMYNFYNEYGDIGVYGSVYYFAEYLAENAGDDVFSNVHEYWRESYSETLCEAEALVNSVSKSFKKKVKNLFSYTDDFEFESDDEEWLSKLTLHFYLYMLADEDGLKAYEEIDRDKLIYNDTEGVDIEGGGRIIVAVKDEEFEIPEDADDGLIYVGLDKNFEVITDFIYKG